MNEDILQEIIRHLDRSTSRDNIWPDKKGNYWPLCPYHNDTKPGSFSVGEKGFNCFSCKNSGSLEKLAKHLGIDLGKFNNQGITLEDYASLKKFTIEFLEDLIVTEGIQKGKRYLKIPYFDQNQPCVRFRIGWKSDIRFKWKSNSKIIPYGLWKLEGLHSCIENGGDKKEIYLVEGESDAQTLWFYEQDALGIPGSTMWKSDWASYLEGYDVYIWQEPDEGGQKFVERIGRNLPDARVVIPPPDRKDISECHISGDAVLDLLNDLKKDARKVRDIHDEEKVQEIQAMNEEAKPLLQDPRILDLFCDLSKELGLVGEDRNAKLIYLALTSRVLDKQINLLIKGPSSGGKSYTLDTVLKAFPPDAYYALSGMSERAIAYSEEPLSHRYLVVYEAAGLNSDFASYLIRSLLSEGRIRYLTVESKQEGIRSRFIERLGPTGLILTTTKYRIHPENETRMLSLSIDDDPEQTKKIIDSLAQKANQIDTIPPDISSWIALQNWIAMGGIHEVVIPFAAAIAKLTDSSAVRMRRDFETVLNFVRASAILQQLNREIDQNDCIVANLDDYSIAYSLIIDLISEGVEKAVKNKVREVVETTMKLSNGGREITQVELARSINLHPSTISRRVNEAIGKGYLINLEDKKGRPSRLIPGDPIPNDIGVLPTPEELDKIFSSNPPNCNATLQETIVHPEGNQCKEKRTTEKSNTKQHLSIDEYLDLISISDIGKPCYACGSNNWERCSDGDRYFCATCHPDENNEIRK